MHGFNWRFFNFLASNSCLTESKALLNSLVKRRTALQYGLSRNSLILGCMTKRVPVELPPSLYAYCVEQR